MSQRSRSSTAGTKLSRRSFLTYASSLPVLGLGATPVTALFSAILGGFGQKAWAESLGLQPRNFIQLLEGGGPARWMYDSFLTPYGSAGFNPNPMVGTRFKNVGGRYIGVEYFTESVRGIQAPPMWLQNIPAPGGGTRPMANLLDNLLCIQGINTKNAGHIASQEWHWLPPGALQSTAAFSADASSAPFAALQVSAGGYAFRSKQNKTPLAVSESGTNMLNNLLDPFRKSGAAQFQTNRSTLRAAYEGLLPALDELAREGHPGAAALTQNRDGALQLMETNFADLTTEWTRLLAKYQDLVKRAIYDPANPLPGFNDLPIGEGGTGSPILYKLTNDNLCQLQLSTDLRTSVDARTTVPRLAERFAFIEYVIKAKLSSSISVGISSIGPFVRESDGAALEVMANDSHFSGLYPTIYFNMLRHRAVAACLLELIDQLKASNMFDDTLISLSGEFNRNPSADMSGSDHGFTGKSLSLYCGAFKGPLIIGNLKNDNRLGWGAGGNIETLGRQLNLVDTSVTLAHLVRVPPPFTSATPIVTLGSAGLASNIGTTKHV